MKTQNEKTKKKNYNNNSNIDTQQSCRYQKFFVKYRKILESDDEKKTIDLKDKVSHNLKTLYSQIMKNNDEYKNRWDFLHDMVRIILIAI